MCLSVVCNTLARSNEVQIQGGRVGGPENLQDLFMEVGIQSEH